ncbi:MAG: TonB family protein [Nitrospirota bacterium]|nr:TonB family protein [Nitrospirota bacterium]MDP2383998.1 TonB family protein [Nitrospirota bacterium]MDP3597757.1 TonB family protein [Nitrospirota bacterium]
MFSSDGQYRLQGWAVSALFHGVALTLALGLMAQGKSVVPKEAFKWDVALVEPQRTQAATTPTQEPAKPTTRQAAPAPAQPQMVTQQVQTREVTPVVQREIRQVVEPSQPIQQTMAVQTRTETVTPIKEQQPAVVQQAQQAVVESIAPVMHHEAVSTEPAIIAASVQQAVSHPEPVTSASTHAVEARAIETASLTRDPDMPASPVPAAAAASDGKPTEAVVREVAPQVAMATSPAPAPAVKADYGWLAESLRRRLAEVKRYPSAARLNGLEGKVVLRAVIRADGHLSDVKVHRSSGHESLDNAAMEAIRLACPLHLKNAIGAAEIAVLVPMVYSLGG